MEFYGDHLRYFIGTVVDNDDPLKLDRVKVRVYGLHTKDTTFIPNEDLPWAQVAIPVTEGGSSGLGANSQLKIRAQVVGIFLDGANSQLPLVIGSIPKIETEKNETSDTPSKQTETGTRVPDQIAAETTATREKPVKDRLDEDMPGITNCEKIFNFFVSTAGGSFTPEQACGMLGNFIQEAGRTQNGDIKIVAESQTDKIVREGKIVRGFGIAQWNPSEKAGNRLGKLIEFSQRRGLNYRSLFAQVNFVKYELNLKPEFYGLSQLKKADSVKEATLIFSRKYERPKADEVVIDEKGNEKLVKHANNPGRVKFAEEQFRKLGRGATP